MGQRGPPGFTCWICFVLVQFYLLLSPYLCFIPFLYLDVYVLEDDALISYGSLIQTKHLQGVPKGMKRF